MVISFWKFRQLVTVSDFDSQGAKSKPETRRLIWVVSWVIWTHGLAARAILVQENWNIFWFRGGFWKIRLLVTTSDLGLGGLIWSVLVSAPHRDPGKVSSLKNKPSRAVLVVAILQSEGFWACSKWDVKLGKLATIGDSLRSWFSGCHSTWMARLSFWMVS